MLNPTDFDEPLTFEPLMVSNNDSDEQKDEFIILMSTKNKADQLQTDQF